MYILNQLQLICPYCYNLIMKKLQVLIMFTFSFLNFGYEIIYALNCGSQDAINSKIVNYTSDEMYEGLTSTIIQKQRLPIQIFDQEDIKLLKTERTAVDSNFSYFLRLKGNGEYLVLFKFIQVAFGHQRQRIFNIKIGDEHIFEIDIIRESGFGVVLHKWVQFELREDIIYISKSMLNQNYTKDPALNAYIYTKKMLKVAFEGLVNKPKVESIILIKGEDTQKFLSKYLNRESTKNTLDVQKTSQKYHIKPSSHTKLLADQILSKKQKKSVYYINKIFLIAALLTLPCSLFILYFKKIYLELRIRVLFILLRRISKMIKKA